MRSTWRGSNPESAAIRRTISSLLSITTSCIVDCPETLFILERISRQRIGPETHRIEMTLSISETNEILILNSHVKALIPFRLHRKQANTFQKKQ